MAAVLFPPKAWVLLVPVEPGTWNVISTPAKLIFSPPVRTILLPGATVFPSTFVPFDEPKSSISMRPFALVICACFRLTLESAMMMSASRPMTVLPALRGCSLPVDSRRIGN